MRGEGSQLVINQLALPNSFKLLLPQGCDGIALEGAVYACSRVFSLPSIYNKTRPVKMAFMKDSFHKRPLVRLAETTRSGQKLSSD
jgi:hypothetical protein